MKGFLTHFLVFVASLLVGAAPFYLFLKYS